MPNDLDILMARVAEINAKTDITTLPDRDLDILVVYYRNQRARRAAGIKTPRAERPKTNLLGLLGIKPQPAAPSGSPMRRLR